MHGAEAYEFNALFGLSSIGPAAALIMALIIAKKGMQRLPVSFSGRRQKVTTKDFRSHQPTGESTLISSRDW
jgi:hypothetical protein